MRGRPTIAIVGAGNFATALAVALREAGYEITAVISRPAAASLKKAQKLARKVGSHTRKGPPANLRADVIWFGVPDAEIAPAARSLANETVWRADAAAGSRVRVALHSSGALTSDELRALRGNGIVVASVHPLMTFVRGSQPSPAGVSFAIEGDPAAVRAARRIVKDLGGLAHTIRKEDKAAYHAWGTFASPLLTALLATTEQVARLAGLRPNAARRRILPILRQTVENYAELGAARGFSGPIVRGDVETVRRHLVALQREPVARAVYASLAKAALQYLPAKNRAALRRALVEKR